MTESSRSSGRRTRDTRAAAFHGWTRTGKDVKEESRRRFAPSGTAILSFAAVVALCSMGIARVHAHNELLALGAEISSLTTEQARLLDEKRRLEAERAYLRHPDHVRNVALNELHMQPAASERIQTIVLGEEER